MTVYEDAVKLEIKADGRLEPIGYFDDEVSAIAAAFECTLIRSAILPELRRLLPEVVIQCEYKQTTKSGKPVQVFRRGTQIRNGRIGRRVVRRPGALAYAWLR